MSHATMNFHLLRKHLGNSNASSCAVLCKHPLNIGTCMSVNVYSSQIILLSLHLTAYVTRLETKLNEILSTLGTLQWMNPREYRKYIIESSVTNQRCLGNRLAICPY